MYGKTADGMLKVIKGSFVISKGINRNGSYVTKANAVLDLTDEVSNAKIDSTLKWHNRLEHVSKKGLYILHK